MSVRPLNVLIAEDGQSQREMLRDFLIKEGHAVAEAENGDQAVQCVLQGHFDLSFSIIKCQGWMVCSSYKK